MGATPQLLVDIARDHVPALDADELASRIDATPTLFVNDQKLES